MVIVGGRHVTRAMRAGALDFVVECSSAKLRGLVEELFQDLHPASSSIPTSVGLLEEIVDGKSCFRLVGASWPAPAVVPADIALDLFVGAINQLALDAEPSLLHLHAGVVARNQECAVICAPSGTGKSTLTAELVRQGWCYLTDETAAFPGDGTTITGFPKPLTIKRNGRRLMPDFADKAVFIEQSERTSWQVPATRIGRLSEKSLEPKLIVLLDRDRGRSLAHASDPNWTMLHPADAVAAMLELTLDACRYGPGALEAVANLAQRCLSVRIAAGSPPQTASLVNDLMDTSGVGAGCTAQLLERKDCDGLLPDYRVASTTSTVVIDARAVVHDSVTRRVASFDEVGTHMWMSLLDRQHPLGFGANLLRLTSFVQTLKAEGLLVGREGEVPTS